MTAKRWKIIDEEFISYTGGTAQLISNGECEIHLWETPKDAQLFCDKLNAINEENEHLKNRVDELEDDNMKYTLSTDKLERYTKRFMPTKCINEFRDCKTNRYYWLDNEDNFTGALELLNLLDCENEQLKTTIQQLRTDNTKQKKKLNTAMKENEHIKTTIKDMINTERTEIGKMTLRHLWRQIQ